MDITRVYDPERPVDAISDVVDSSTPKDESGQEWAPTKGVGGCHPLTTFGVLIYFMVSRGSVASRLHPCLTSTVPAGLKFPLRWRSANYSANSNLSSSDDDGEIAPLARQYQCALRAPNYDTS